MDTINITLNLSVAQINVILKYVGAGAFAEVENVIAAIREQASPQLAAAAQSSQDEKPAEASVN